MGIFDIVHGEQGDSIVLNGMRIAGPSYQVVPKVTLDKLRAENAELREFCSALYEFAYDEYPDGTELNFADRMRELGVEVKV